MSPDTVLFPNFDEARRAARRRGALLAPALRGARRAWCALVGHDVDNRVFASRRSAARACVRCGEEILREDGSETRVAHTLSCFLTRHSYAKAADRDGHVESVCERCGHPLVVAERSRYARRERFLKRVDYGCGLLGHRVHEVAERDGFVEYACDCGHSFLVQLSVVSRRSSAEGLPRARRAAIPEARVGGSWTIRHPLVCVATGHRVRFVARRAGFAEFRCRDCGHPFCHPEWPRRLAAQSGPSRPDASGAARDGAAA